MLNIAVVAPIASDSVATMTNVKPGARDNFRVA
jgi:hypothetical protein